MCVTAHWPWRRSALSECHSSFNFVGIIVRSWAISGHSFKELIATFSSRSARKHTKHISNRQQGQTILNPGRWPQNNNVIWPTRSHLSFQHHTQQYWPEAQGILVGVQRHSPTAPGYTANILVIHLFFKIIFHLMFAKWSTDVMTYRWLQFHFAHRVAYYRYEVSQSAAARQ